MRREGVRRHRAPKRPPDETLELLVLIHPNRSASGARAVQPLSNPVGRYMVTEYEDNIELGGMFFDSLADAEEHVENICNTIDD